MLPSHGFHGRYALKLSEWMLSRIATVLFQSRNDDKSVSGSGTAQQHPDEITICEMNHLREAAGDKHQMQRFASWTGRQFDPGSKNDDRPPLIEGKG